MTIPTREATVPSGSADSTLTARVSLPSPRSCRLNRGLVFCAAGVVLFVVLVWRLGGPTFWDPDEAHYAETTRELMRTGDWLAPHYNEEPFFDKPILFHWLQAAAMAIAGPSELGARLIPSMAALALVCTTAWVGVRLSSPEAAIIASLLLAANPGVFGLARYAILDTLFTAFVFGGAALISVAAVRGRPGLQWFGYVLLALGVLTKGPLAVVLCGVAFLIAIASSRQLRRRLLELRLLAGTGLIVAIAAPWFVYMWIRFGDAFIDGYVLDENLRLYASQRFAPTASSSVWFYVRVIAAGFVPWTALLAGRLYDDIRAALRRDGSLDEVDVLLWSWAIGIVGFFTLSTFKLDHYVFPAAPALCLLCARSWIGARRPVSDRDTGARVALHVIGPLTVAVALAGAYVLLFTFELPSAALAVPAIVGAAGAAMVYQTSIARRPPSGPWLLIGALTATYAGVVLWVLPALEQRKVIPDIARWTAQRAAPEQRIATYRLNRWNTAFRFYVDRHVSMIDSPEEARSLFTGREPFYCVMQATAFDEFASAGMPLRIVYDREGLWVTSGRALWRRRTPLTRFVVVTRAP